MEHLGRTEGRGPSAGLHGALLFNLHWSTARWSTVRESSRTNSSGKRSRRRKQHLQPCGRANTYFGELLQSPFEWPLLEPPLGI